MRTFLLCTQDSTIYERFPTLNSGLDEVVEIGKVVKPLDGTAQYATASARILMSFDVPSEQQYPSGSKYYLNLRIANATEVHRYQKINVYLVSGSWIEGSGYSYQDIRNVGDGVSWINSQKNISWNSSGSDYTSSISASYTLSNVPIDDVKIDVTSLVYPVVAGINTLPWNGLLIKFPDEDEQDYSNKGNIKFFSGNTHTIFAPKLEIVWDDQIFNTGTLKALPNANVSIIPRNLKESYTQGEKDLVRLIVRDKYPDKRFDATQRYKTMYYLPSESYFRIRDSAADVVIYDFDKYSKLHCDVSGSYFVLDTSFLDVNRYYTIDLKIKSTSLVFFPEFTYTFKVDTDE